MQPSTSSQYGQSTHYDSVSGDAYFAYQNQLGPLTGRLNAPKFAPLIRAEDSVLDFGCGGGWLLRELPGATKLGVEPNPAARECCRRNGVVAVATVGELPVGLSFDIVVSNHVLEHVPYPIAALRELRSRLKPRGKLALVLPIDDWRGQADHSGRDIDHHLHTWTPRLLANTLVEAGFKVDSVEILTDAWPRGVKVLSRLPAAVFRTLCFAWSVLRRQRQLVAVATPADQCTVPRAA